MSTISTHPCFVLDIVSKRDQASDIHLSRLSTHTHIHPFNGPFSGNNRVSQYQRGKTNLDFTEVSDSEWQWHQLGHMQVCISLHTDNHASTPLLSFLQAGWPSCRPTNSVKALKPVIHLSSIHLERFDCSRFPMNLMQYCKYSEADTYDTLPPCCCLLSESSSFDTYLTSLPLYVYNIGAQSKPCTCTHTTLCLNQIMTAAAAATTTTPI